MNRNGQPVTFSGGGSSGGQRALFFALAVLLLALLAWWQREELAALLDGQAPTTTGTSVGSTAASDVGGTPRELTAMAGGATLQSGNRFAPPPHGTEQASPPGGDVLAQLASLRGLSGHGIATNLSLTKAELPHHDGELPLFAALRASRKQPIPPEVAALARRITEGLESDSDRARALYNWLTANIRYDVQEWVHVTSGGDSYTHEHDPLSVLQRGTTVCIGYSWLFDALAESVGLYATYLIGDVRGFRGTPDENLISAFKHAWNAVQIDGEWQLLDVTWGARQVGEKENDYLARRDYYFDTPARQMIFDHLPEERSWQLLNEPVASVAAFRDLPNLKPPFFNDGLKLGNAFAATLHTAPNTVGSIIVSSPENTHLAATLMPLGNSGEATQIPVIRQKERNDIVVGPLAEGQYLVRLYSRSGTPDGPYECAADFVVSVKE